MDTGELLGKPKNFRGVTCDGLASLPRGEEILLAASCYGNRVKLRPDEPVWVKGFTSHRYIYIHTFGCDSRCGTEIAISLVSSA